MNQVKSQSANHCEKWASHPWHARKGECVALAVRHDRLHVAIRKPGLLVWVPAETVMSESELRRWMESGFNRR